jgi:hypothetical protein
MFSTTSMKRGHATLIVFECSIIRGFDESSKQIEIIPTIQSANIQKSEYT